MFVICQSVCACVCYRGKPTSQWTGDFWLKSVLHFWVSVVSIFLRFENKLFFGSLQPAPLCLMGELAGRWSVAVAVGISDR